MSPLFSSWSVQARQILGAAGPRPSLSQTQQILAAGLGHKTLSSFKLADEAQLAGAHRALISTQAMTRRAHDLGIQLSDEACKNVVMRLRLPTVFPTQFVCELGSMASVVMSVMSDKAPEVERISKEFGWTYRGTTVLHVRQGVGLEDTGGWRWLAIGELDMESSRGFWTAPFEAEVLFPKLGNHLLNWGQVSNFRRSGEPRDADLDDYFEGYVSESDS